MAAYTFPSAVVLIEATGDLAIGATGVLRPSAGGNPVQVYDLNGSPIPNVVVGARGVHQPFQADIPDGVLDFGSVLLTSISQESMTAAITAEQDAAAALEAAQQAADNASNAVAAVESAVVEAELDDPNSTVSQKMRKAGVLLPFWSPGELVTANTIRVAPDGRILSRIADGTTRSAFDPTEVATWNIVSSGGGTGGGTLDGADIIEAPGQDVDVTYDAGTGKVTIGLPEALALLAYSGAFGDISGVPNMPEVVRHDGTADPVRPATPRPVIWDVPDGNRPATNGTTAGGSYASVPNLDYLWTHA